LFAVAAALAGLLAACGGSDDPAPAPTPPAAAVAPTITTPPAAAAVTEGQSASFTVVAAGSAPLAYEWRRNGSTISGAVAASYTLAAATLADNAAAFSVVVSNSAGSVTSGAALLTVNPLAVIPTITAQPAPLVLTAGSNASFSATASGTPAPTLRWFIAGGADLADGAGTGPLAGATVTGASTSSLTLTAVPQSANGLQVRLRAANTAGTAESSAAALTVNAATVAPSITSQPGAVTLTAGATATFTVAASGTPMPTVQWLIAGGADLADGVGSGALAGATIAGAASTTLTLTNVPQSATGLQLAARATNSAGTVTSSSAALTVNSAGVAISASAGGTATSADGMVRAVFPPNAFTADTVVTFTPVPAPALPSGNEPFAEDFASFQPVQGGFYRLDFAGGLLKPDVEVEYGLQSQAATTVARAASAQVRPLSPPPGNPPRATVIRCSDGSTQVYMGSPGAGYDTARAIFCGGDPSNTVTVGPAIVIAPPSAVLGERTLARQGDDRLLNVISFNNGRSAFGFQGLVPPGNVVVGLGIIAANGAISAGFPAGGATLVGFDGNGQVLAQISGCRLAAFGQRVSTLLGASINPTPTWTVQLPTNPPFNECAAIFGAAPVPGGGWVVATGGNLDRYSSTGVATPLLRPLTLPGSDIRRQISYRRLAVDAAGNIWGLGSLNRSSFFPCGFEFQVSGPCPAVVKLDSTGALIGYAQLGNALVQRPTEIAPVALALDAAGNAYTAQATTEFVSGASTTGTGGIVVSRIASNSVTTSWSTRLSNTRGQEGVGEVAINATTGQVFISSAPNGIVHRLDGNGAETGVVTAGAPFARSVINGLSINPTGTLTYIGDLRGTLGSTTSATCILPDARPCVDVLVRRFNF
jgi:hypothetical protein